MAGSRAVLARRGGQRLARALRSSYTYLTFALQFAAYRWSGSRISHLDVMGCTSSAPSTLSANGNTAEKMQFVEEAADVVVSKSEAVEKFGDAQTAVLPSSCDRLIETIVNNNKSTASLQTESDHQDQNPDQTELEDKIEIPQDNEYEEKLSKLEEVVEKVVEIIHCTDDTDQIATDTPAPSGSSPSEESNVSNTVVELDTPMEPTKEEFIDVTTEDNEVENESVENPEDSDMSPSEFSRATRWEALADIGAELPPSLAVDPITGQIYSLTK